MIADPASCADREPNVELTVARTNLSETVHLEGYNHLVSASDWGHPLSFGSSFSALMFGRDEGFYYRASGAELGGSRDAPFGGARIDWRAFVEEQRTAAVRTKFAVDGSDFPANLVARRGTVAERCVDRLRELESGPAFTPQGSRRAATATAPHP